MVKFNKMKFDRKTITMIVSIKLIVIFVVILIYVDTPITFDTGALITFDATSSGGKASAQGVESSTKTSPSESSGDTEGGGGSLTSDTGGGGFQAFSRDTITTFTNSHSVGKGQSTNGLFKVDWNHSNSIQIRDVNFGQYNDIVKVNNPPITLKGEGTFGKADGTSSGDVGYILNVPSNFDLKRFQIPVTFVIESNGQIFVGNTFIDVDVSDNFNILEFLRSLLTAYKLSVTESSVL